LAQAGGIVSDLNTVVVYMPRYTSAADLEAATAFNRPLGGDSPLRAYGASPISSLLEATFNSCWAAARNAWEDGEADGFAMIHADCATTPGWVDVLHREMRATGADVIAAVIPIKDAKGLSSTAVDDTGNEWHPRRLTMKEVHALPETFTEEDVPGLLLNTGLWLCRLGAWCLETQFNIESQLVRNAKGRWQAEVKPEDWDFSRQCRRLGLKLAATRKVRVLHHGDYVWDNQQVWGWETDRANGRPQPQAAGAQA
jgi:hypothetical protein